MPVSAPPAPPAHGWLSGHLASAPGFGVVRAGAAASAVLPMAAGALMRVRPVPLGAPWARDPAVTAAVAVAVVAVADFVLLSGA
ncbi:hypothetical protein ADK52_32520 [Streptomyces sp. WM6372]|uniref:hypothetical protein n=1 Tax=Streptomyces sp. WM6372 TaxID=1415555 RepID=UPI0006AFD4BB|nr:hypothetical protein [Streptomyces sp. WM6372]KOU16972.1 hypothetical protein ADK52_32520 [Streptomyces sp. WM6372]